jgi:hypothetical protein
MLAWEHLPENGLTMAQPYEAETEAIFEPAYRTISVRHRPDRDGTGRMKLHAVIATQSKMAHNKLKRL